MSLPRMIFYGGIVLFLAICTVAVVKKTKHSSAKTNNTAAVQKPSLVQEIPLEKPSNEIAVKKESAVKKETAVKPVSKEKEKPHQVKEKEPIAESKKGEDKLPEANVVDKLFVTDSSKLDVVESLCYTSRVPWLKGRPAWIADYASQFETTRHFIARSLNKKTDYFTQKVSPGDRFNVLKKNVSFYLLIDLSRAKLWFYVLNKDTNKRTLLKTYVVGLGRKDSSRPSGYLTPVGKYSLGNKVAIYKPGTMGYFQDRKIEMIRVFGTRWIPFDKTLDGCSASPQGYGIHGAPWTPDSQTNMLVEDKQRIGAYESDGCVRLAADDIEEIFAIVISKPTVIELVKDFHEALLPGVE